MSNSSPASDPLVAFDTPPFDRTMADRTMADRLLEVAPIAMYVCARDGAILRFNRRAAELWGRTPRLDDPSVRFCGSQQLYRLDGGLLPHAECPMAEVLRTGIGVRDQEVVIEQPDGTRLIALVNIDALEDDAGTIVGAMNYFQDITQRKQLEHELKEFFDNAVVALHCVSSEGVILRANQAELDLLGYDRDEYIGHHIAEFHADGDTVQEILARLSGGVKLDKHPARLRAKNGAIKHVLISSNSYFQGDRFIHTRCFTIDVTERERAEREMRASERRSRELLAALPVAVYTTDAEGRITYFNQAAVDLWGHSPELGSSEWCGPWRSFWPDGRPMSHDECPMATAVKQGRAIRGAEAIAERPDGTRVPFIPYPTPLRDESGALIGAVNTLVDISERKREEDRQHLLLREMNHRIKNVFALANSLLALSAHAARSPEDLVSLAGARLTALARAHELTLPDFVNGEEKTKATSLADLLSAILAPYVDPNPAHAHVVSRGPDVPIGGRAVAGLALLLHECTTNAVKYGALSSPTGRVAIDWRVDNANLVLTWQERGGPVLVGPPAAEGFGSLLARQTVNRQLGGEIARDWSQAGLTVHLSVPLVRLTE